MDRNSYIRFTDAYKYYLCGFSSERRYRADEKRYEMGGDNRKLVLMTFLVNENSTHYLNVWLVLATIFLILYYMVWIRYFIGKRDVALLAKPFLFVPIPLAVFPVLYYLFAGIWVGNYPAAIVMIIFGAAHITVSVQSFR